MTQDELRSRVQRLLKLENEPVVDWQVVEAACAQLSYEIGQMPTDEVPDLLWHFVDDADIRRKDAAYGDRQRSELWLYADTGEMVEHAPSFTISDWGCLAAIGVVAVALGMLWLKL